MSIYFETEVKSAIISIAKSFEKISNSLEKIADKEFNINTNNYTTNPKKGEFISPYDYRNNVWCDTNINQNKDSYVDKNIISD